MVMLVIEELGNIEVLQIFCFLWVGYYDSFIMCIANLIFCSKAYCSFLMIQKHL